MKTRKLNVAVLIVCALYFFISVLFFHFYRLYDLSDLPLVDDAFDYVSAANNMLKIALFSQDGLNPDYVRTPGYPLFIAMVFMLGGSVAHVAALQIALSTLSVFLIYKILRLLKTPANTALIGTALFLFDIGSYRYASTILSETLFKVSLICSLYFLVKYYVSTKKFRYFSAFAVLINFALLVRPILQYFNMFLAAALIIMLLFKKARFKTVAAFLLCFATVFIGWSYRNYRHSNVFIYSTIRNNNLMYYDSRIMVERRERLSEAEAFLYHEQKFDAEYPSAKSSDLNEAQLSILRAKYGSRYLKTHFWQYIKQNAMGLFKLMISPHRDIVKKTFPNSQFAVYLTCALYATYLAAMWALFIYVFADYKKIDAVRLFILLLTGYLAITGASGGYFRFRDPIFPLLLIGVAGNGKAIIERITAAIGNKNRVISKVNAWLLKE